MVFGVSWNVLYLGCVCVYVCTGILTASLATQTRHGLQIMAFNRSSTPHPKPVNTVGSKKLEHDPGTIYAGLSSSCLWRVIFQLAGFYCSWGSTQGF